MEAIFTNTLERFFYHKSPSWDSHINSGIRFEPPIISISLIFKINFSPILFKLV